VNDDDPVSRNRQAGLKLWRYVRFQEHAACAAPSRRFSSILTLSLGQSTKSILESACPEALA